MDYLTFLETFTQVFVETSGMDRDKVQFEEKGGSFSSSGDRLLIEFVDRGELKEICALHIEELYGLYQRGCSIEELVEEIMEDIENVKKSQLLQRVKEMSCYDKVREEMFVRLINKDQNQEGLEGTIYKTIGDIALVVYVRMAENENGISSMKIPDSYMEIWNKDKEEILKEALLNTYFIAPPRMYRWEGLVFDPEYSGDNFMDLANEHVLVKGEMGNCISTSRKIEGAIAVFLPGVAERIYNLLGADFYIVFTSVHEAMIHNVESAKKSELQEVLNHITEEVTPKEEFLSGCVYRYSHETMTFSCVSGCACQDCSQLDKNEREYC